MIALPAVPIHFSYVDEFCDVIEQLYKPLLSDSESGLLSTLTKLPQSLAWRAVSLLSRKSLYLSSQDEDLSTEDISTLLKNFILEPYISNTPSEEVFLSASRNTLLDACTKVPSLHQAYRNQKASDSEDLLDESRTRGFLTPQDFFDHSKKCFLEP